MAFAIGATQFKMPEMNTRLTIDGAGRVVLPKPVRDELDLGPGDFLELESAGDKITLRPLRAAAPLTKEQGVWVFRTGQPLAATVTEAVLQQVRNDRDKHNFDPKA
jgi:AbrB family looped-hinge helix DNA binding protein